MVIAVAPNPDGFLGTRLIQYFKPYADFFQFGALWNFFAPDPAPPMVVIEWELIKNGQAYETGQLPEFPRHYFFEDRFNKRVSFSRFISMDDRKLDTVMTAWLCRTHPEAEGVRLFTLIHALPKLRDLEEGRAKLEDMHKPLRRFIAHSPCARPVGGEL